MHPEHYTDLDNFDTVQSDLRHSAKGVTTPTTSPTPSHQEEEEVVEAHFQHMDHISEAMSRKPSPRVQLSERQRNNGKQSTWRALWAFVT